MDEFWSLSAESSEKFEHIVAWVDCGGRGSRFGRGVFSRANWSNIPLDLFKRKSRNEVVVPFDAPNFALNRGSIAVFNELYFRVGRLKSGKHRQHYETFFYPLDAVRNWNRLYGRRGMYQYQCVIPQRDAQAAIVELLGETTRSGQASFLSVLKMLGNRPAPGLLSFSRPGATLAMDFPNNGDATLRLLARLDAIVAEAGGALYPAKDGRLPADMFRLSFPRWTEFNGLKDERMSSDFWRRVAG